MDTGLVIGCAVAGLVVGAALDGPIARLPIDERDGRRGLFIPRCHQCASVAPRTLIPLVRVPCRMCGARPLVRTLAVELLTAALFAGCAFRLGTRLALVPFLFLAAVVVVVAFIDIDHHRIPDRVTFPSLLVSAILITGTSIAAGYPHALLDAALGALAFSCILCVFHVISPAGMGFGDVKLGLLLGLYLGWISLQLVIWGLLIGSLIGVVIGVGVAVARHDRKTAFPFGPALGVGTMVAVVLAPHLIS
jgi:leader peptidase (prepilin peptidase) / N-methyltransferase